MKEESKVIGGRRHKETGDRTGNDNCRVRCIK